MIHNIAAAIGATTRIVRKRERDGKAAEAVIAERSYDTSIEDLWDAITNPERLPRWFGQVTGDLKLGGRFQIKNNADGSILACDPPKTLEVTWEYAGGMSWVEVHLRAVSAEETHLQLVHEAIVDPEWAAKYGPGAVGVGWDLWMLGLQTHLASGWSKPEGHDEEYGKTDDYKHFVRTSSAGWRDASIAAGNDAEIAKAAAENTTGFYLGEAPAGDG
jgi:uncharacterized protein YndB with AHSA1/START domain